MEEDIRHFVLETKNLGTFDVVEYKEYQELQERIDKAIEQLEELKNLYDDNYTISDKAENIINILKGVDKK